MRKNTQKIGQWGEGIAVDYLLEKGYQVLDRNVYSSGGEIDIVAVRSDTRDKILVFIEVKTRTSSEYGYPEEGFTRAKYDHLMAAIQDYLARNPGMDCEWQIDLIAVLGHPLNGRPQINHFEQVVIPDDD
jgi:putative endonuclease